LLLLIAPLTHDIWDCREFAGPEITWRFFIGGRFSEDTSGIEEPSMLRTKRISVVSVIRPSG
jgi:hypothetical protein